MMWIWHQQVFSQSVSARSCMWEIGERCNFEILSCERCSQRVCSNPLTWKPTRCSAAAATALTQRNASSAFLAAELKLNLIYAPAWSWYCRSLHVTDVQLHRSVKEAQETPRPCFLTLALLILHIYRSAEVKDERAGSASRQRASSWEAAVCALMRVRFQPYVCLSS